VNGIVVLNTRPREQAAELTRLLGQAGFEVIEAPAVTTVASWEQRELDRTRRELATGAYDWVVLPSQNAARGLEPDLRETRVRIVCGAATAIALDVRATIALDRFSAAAAIDALKLHLMRGQRALVPHAAEGRDELVDGLRSLGADVFAPVAYRTVPVDDAARRLKRGGVDVVTVCSPSAVRSITAALPAERLVVCLGETTAEAARNAGWPVAGVADGTTMSALVEAVERVARVVRV
jgi:uroporphyrinogen-III synthase